MSGYSDASSKPTPPPKPSSTPTPPVKPPKPPKPAKPSLAPSPTPSPSPSPTLSPSNSSSMLLPPSNAPLKRTSAPRPPKKPSIPIKPKPKLKQRSITTISTVRVPPTKPPTKPALPTSPKPQPKTPTSHPPAPAPLPSPTSPSPSSSILSSSPVPSPLVSVPSSDGSTPLPSPPLSRNEQIDAPPPDDSPVQMAVSPAPAPAPTQEMPRDREIPAPVPFERAPPDAVRALRDGPSLSRRHTEGTIGFDDRQAQPSVPSRALKPTLHRSKTTTTPTPPAPPSKNSKPTRVGSTSSSSSATAPSVHHGHGHTRSLSELHNHRFTDHPRTSSLSSAPTSYNSPSQPQRAISNSVSSAHTIRRPPAIIRTTSISSTASAPAPYTKNWSSSSSSLSPRTNDSGSSSSISPRSSSPRSASTSRSGGLHPITIPSRRSGERIPLAGDGSTPGSPTGSIIRNPTPPLSPSNFKLQSTSRPPPPGTGGRSRFVTVGSNRPPPPPLPLDGQGRGRTIGIDRAVTSSAKLNRTGSGKQLLKSPRGGPLPTQSPRTSPPSFRRTPSPSPSPTPTPAPSLSPFSSPAPLGSSPPTSPPPSPVVVVKVPVPNTPTPGSFSSSSSAPPFGPPPPRDSPVIAVPPPTLAARVPPPSTTPSPFPGPPSDAPPPPDPPPPKDPSPPSLPFTHPHTTRPLSVQTAPLIPSKVSTPSPLPTPSIPPYVPRKHSFEDVEDPSTLVMDGDLVRAASWTRLISLLTSQRGIDVDDFLLTYRAFAHPSELMVSLFDRFFTTTEKVVRLRTFKVIKTWLGEYWQDFDSNYGVIQTLDDFLQEVGTRTPEFESTASGIKDLLLRKLNNVERSVSHTTMKMEPSILPSDLSVGIMQFSPIEIARQLTLREWEIWAQIKPFELLGLAWTSKEKNFLQAPHVLAMTDRFNEVSGWVTTMICTCENKNERIKMFKKFVEMADALRRMGNFNGMMEVVSGFDRGAVHRMKKVHANMRSDKKIATMYAECVALANSDKNYLHLRDAIKLIDPPVIPYLGMYLTDLTFTEEGNKDRVDGLIHYTKCRMLSNTIKSIKQYQLKGYETLTVVRVMQEKLNSLTVLSEAALYSLSNYLEPRDGKKPHGDRPILLDEVKLGGGVIDARLARGALLKDILLTDIRFKDATDWPFATKDEEGVNVVTDSDTQQIVSLSIPKLIELMTKPIQYDATIIMPFLSIYKEVLSSSALLKLLRQRFHVPEADDQSEKMLSKYERTLRGPIRLRVYEVMKQWVFFSWNEFRRDSSLMKELESFIEEFTEWYPAWGENLREMIVRNDTETSLRLNSLQDYLNPTESFHLQTASIFEFDALDVAQQMTMDAYAHVSTKIDPWYLLEEAKAAMVSGSVLRLHNVTDIIAMITDARVGVVLRDRRKKFKTVKCFSDVDAVVWFSETYALSPTETNLWCQHLVTLKLLLPLGKDSQFASGTYWRFAPQTDMVRILREQRMKEQLTFSNSNDSPVMSIINYHLAHVAGKVVAEITRAKKAQMCDLGIREYIKVCLCLEKIHNIHSLQAVLCALLQMSNRYPEDYERVPKEERDHVDRILDRYLLPPSEFDETVVALPAPCIPCFGSYFHMIINAFKLHGAALDRNSLYNVQRLHKIGAAIGHLSTTQRLPPFFSINPEIQSFLNQSYR